MSASPALCKICGGHTTRIADHPGYLKNSVFDIFECAGCQSSFAWPLVIPPDIYEMIYKNARNLPGYKRYYAYAAKIKLQSAPLDFLAHTEDVYWAIRDFVDRFMVRGGSILEVGSGLGYVTYSLIRAGYAALGIEHSEIAVSNAESAFGSNYICGTTEDMIAQGRQFDAVISSEVIEHLPDPLRFVDQLLQCALPGGRVFITTPNKSYFPSGCHWITEAPPVHLWWLTEASMSYIAKTLAVKYQLTDFSRYNNEHPNLSPREIITRPIYNSVLDSDGSPLDNYHEPDSHPVLRRWAGLLRNTPLRYLSLPGMRLLARIQRGGDMSRRGTLAVTFQK